MLHQDFVHISYIISIYFTQISAYVKLLYRYCIFSKDRLILRKKAQVPGPVLV